MKKKLNFLIDTQNLNDETLRSNVLSEFGSDAEQEATVIFGKSLKIAKQGLMNFEEVDLTDDVVQFVWGATLYNGVQANVDNEKEENGEYTFDIYDEDGNKIDTSNSIFVVDFPIEMLTNNGLKDFSVNGRKILENGIVPNDEYNGYTSVEFDKLDKIISFPSSRNEVAYIPHNSFKHTMRIGEETIVYNDLQIADPYATETITDGEKQYDAPVFRFIYKYELFEVVGKNNNGTLYKIVDGKRVEYDNRKDIAIYQYNVTQSIVNIYIYGRQYKENSNNDIPDIDDYEKYINDDDILVIGDLYSGKARAIQKYTKSGEVIRNKTGFKVTEVAGKLDKKIMQNIKEATDDKLSQMDEKLATIDSLVSTKIDEKLSNMQVNFNLANGTVINSSLVFDSEKNAYVLDYDTSSLDGTGYTIELQLDAN